MVNIIAYKSLPGFIYISVFFVSGKAAKMPQKKFKNMTFSGQTICFKK